MTDRSPPISYRPPKALEAELFERQLRSGLSMNAFITRSIFGVSAPRQSRRPPVEKGDLARLLNHATRISDRLHEMAHGKGGNAVPIEAAMDELAVIRTALLKALGKGLQGRGP